MKFYRLFLVAVIGFLTTTSFSQTENAASAQVDVVVVDTKNIPREGQTVIFNGVKNNQLLSGTTNKAGKLTIKLPAGDDYEISVKDNATENQKSVLSIPELKEGETITGAYKVNIVYEPSRTITLSNVQFDVSKATLKPTSYKDLQELLDYLKSNKSEKVEIGGHTDSSGIEEKNVLLSQQRADVIKAYLIKNGVAEANVYARGYGSSMPIADNQTPEGKAKNRRIEVRRIVE